MKYIESNTYVTKTIKNNEWVNVNTVALSVNTLTVPKISDIISLLEEAKERFGDIPVLVDDTQHNLKCDLTTVYLSPAYNYTEYGENESKEATCNFIF